jgi:hypothetical protein
MSLPDTVAENLIAQIMIDFSGRHKDIGHIFERHLNEVKGYLPRDAILSDVQRALIGAYFTKEYAVESAALFNPSIVPHPDQSHLNKGMALFPRKIGGRYAMLSRQDGENNHIMFSDNIHFWQKSQIIQEPEYPWEFMQIGNCGSPLETDKGWIVLTHGVGPMRQYCIGAMLLDLEKPSKIIARLDEPLLAPHEKEREGYVPNVVYSCGAIIRNNELVIPYAMSDINSGIAVVEVRELISCMHAVA